MSGGRFEFGDFILDAAHFRLTEKGRAVRIEPRAFEVLHYLLQHRDRVVPKHELLDNVWGDRFVSDAALTTALRTARAAIGDSGGTQRLIRTAHGRGYHFTAPVATDDSPLDAVPEDRQRIRFCRSKDGARIAWASVGSGPPLLKAANWITHLDLEWNSTIWGHWLHALSRDRTLIRYDERGCGLSDWDTDSATFEDWVDDLEAVVAASGLERFPLLGVSQGGAVAIAYAARHPERVSALILAGAYAQGRAVRAVDEVERREANLDLDLARVGWAREDPSFLRVFASQFLPEGTVEDWDAFTAFQRRTTSPQGAVRFLEEFARIDVSALAATVRSPTLILHSRRDRRVPAAQATELAALIPDSSLALLDSANHLPTAAEPAWGDFLSHVDAFLADHPA